MRKLTESDKKEILKLYRETAETTSTLAERYDVSNSTISRLLKSTLPEDEYEYLVSLKRAARTPEGRAQVSYDNLPVFGREEEEQEEEQLATPVVAQKVVEVQPQEEPEKEKKPKPRKVIEPTLTKSKRESQTVVEPTPTKSNRESEKVFEPVSTKTRRVKRRSSISDEEQEQLTLPVIEEPIAEQLELLEQQSSEIRNIPSQLGDNTHPQTNVIAEMFGEELLDESDDLDDLDDLDEEYDDDEDDEDFEERPRLVARTSKSDSVRVLPLSAAALPKTCYLVIDRSSELITRPLRDFGDLGQIPNLETQQRTLPVFDNHRVAKRFSTKRDRVIKIPDSKMLHKARYHLHAKGITRLLIDGQVYSLSPTTV
ncbi:transposase [Scytonema sp. UIC 10036]|uniref:transposase n=1 Tax=Scytonema sp. UIC 10036 TaxID=2304196 RepID=UPI0013823682|nr:transposase [Scytonema sp. UIC 10036]